MRAQEVGHLPPVPHLLRHHPHEGEQVVVRGRMTQQRNLLGHAPTDYDLLALMRVMTEEMRHGWQMSYLLCAHFGDEGKREAAKLLERRADDGERLLGSFNEIVATWLDFFT